MPTSITRLSKFTIPIAGLNPQGAGLPTHNMISLVAGERGREKRGKTGRRTCTKKQGEEERGEGERKKGMQGTFGGREEKVGDLDREVVDGT